MDISTLLLFSATVIPLVCTPGPDILFVASQAVSTGTAAGFRATAGIILGYCVHSLLVALGLAAVVAASPLLFEIIRWTGISYLVFLAAKLVRAAMRPGGLQASRERVRDQLYKGFLTSLLNPKGMLVYLAILPQFMDRQQGNTTVQALLLSAAFMFWCAVVYSAVCVGFGRRRQPERVAAAFDRWDGWRDDSAGGGFMALAHR